MTPKIGDLRTVTQRFDGKEWVLCLQSMPLKELSDDEIVKLWFKCGDDEYTVRRFARAIEKRHGIKTPNGWDNAFNKAQEK